MIELNKISKSYDSFWAVRDLSTTVDAGEIIGLVGPNGAGKTTTMKIITGFLVPSAGDVQVNGIDVISHPTAAQELIGYLPEHNPIYPDMSVQDYLVFVGKMRGLGGSNLKERLRFAAGACQLGEKITASIATLSKGFRQRVGIAQAIIHDPKILILDEPTSGLDPNQIAEIRDLIRELGQDKTVILSTHILSEVEETCSRALMMVGGRLAVDDHVANLSGSRSLRFVLCGADLDVESTKTALIGLDGLGNLEQIATAPDRLEFRADMKDDDGAAVFRLAVSQGWELAELSPERRSLEDVFREVSNQGGVPS